MRQTPVEDVEALRGRLRVISHEIQHMSAGKDEFTARKMSWKGCWIIVPKSWTLQQKSILLVNIASLERDAEYDKKVADMEWLDLMLFLENQLSDMDEQLFLLRDEEKRYSAAFDKLIAERQNAHSALKCFLSVVS